MPYDWTRDGEDAAERAYWAWVSHHPHADGLEIWAAGIGWAIRSSSAISPAFEHLSGILRFVERKEMGVGMSLEQER
jgi:hypothetical protein